MNTLPVASRPAGPAETPVRLPWSWLALAALAYAGLFAWYSWPLSRSVGSAFVGQPGGDANQFIWNVWNFQRQLAAGHNPMRTPLLFYPQGTGLWLHTYTPILGALNVVLRQEYLTLNLGLLLTFVLSGVGAAGGALGAAAAAVPADRLRLCVLALQAGPLARAY